MQFSKLLQIFRPQLKILAIATALLASSCAVQIKDETSYVDAGPAGAVTVNFLSSGSVLIPPAQWNLMREGMYCMSAESWGDFKTEIEELCSVYPCDEQAKVTITNFFERASMAHDIAAQLSNRRLQ